MADIPFLIYANSLRNSCLIERRYSFMPAITPLDVCFVLEDAMRYLCVSVSEGTSSYTKICLWSYRSSPQL